MVAGENAGALAGAGGHPAAGGKHGGLVVFEDLAAVVRADVAHGAGHVVVGFVFIPAQAVRGLGAHLQRLHFAAMRAGYVVDAGVALQVAGFDLAEVLDGGRAGFQHLAPGEGAGALFGQDDGGAFAVHVLRVGVGLVEEQVANGHRAQAGRAVSARYHQHAAGKVFHQGGVGVVAAAVFAHLAAQGGRFLQHGGDALAAESLGHVGGGLHAHDGAGLVVDDVAKPVVAGFAFAELRREHHHHFLHGAAGAEIVHDLAQVGRAVGAPWAGLAGGFAAQHAVGVGPFADGLVGGRAEKLGPHAGGQGLGAGVVGGEVVGAHGVRCRRLRGLVRPGPGGFHLPAAA